LRIILRNGLILPRPHPGSAHTDAKEQQMNEFFSPVPARAALATHSAGHSNALVENPFDEVEAVEAQAVEVQGDR